MVVETAKGCGKPGLSDAGPEGEKGQESFHGIQRVKLVDNV